MALRCRTCLNQPPASLSKRGGDLSIPDGVIWDRNNVMFIAIGVIAKESEHIDVLREVASIFSDEVIARALSLIANKEDF